MGGTGVNLPSQQPAVVRRKESNPCPGGTEATETTVAPEAGPRPRSASASAQRVARGTVAQGRLTRPGTRGGDGLTSTPGGHGFVRSTTPGEKPLHERTLSPSSPSPTGDLPQVSGGGARTQAREEIPKAVEPRAVAIPSARQVTSDGPQSMHAPLKPSEKRPGATAPRPNRCWASGAQPTDVPSVTGHGDPEVAERGAASARGSTGRKPLPPPSGALRDSGHLEPPGSKGSKSRPTSAQGQVDGHGAQGSEKTRATSVLPASGRHPLPAGAAAAAVAAMEAINGGEVGTESQGLEGFPSRLKEEGPRPATDGPALSGEASSKASDWVHGSTSVSHVAGSQTSTAASSGAAGANRKGSSAGSTGKHDGRSVPLTPHSGPGAEGDPPGTLLGAENLPMVGAAGVLALPKRQQLAEQAPEKPTKKSARLVGADASDLLAAGELHGWGGDYEDVPPYQLYDLSKAERKFKRYVEEATKASDREWVAEDGVDLDQVRVLTMGQPDPKPVQGPGILQLAKDPARREECPVCNAEWAQALRCMSEGRPPPAREAPSPQMARKQSTGQKRNPSQKMHSVQCTFHWFQQNLCALLCNLRFDSRGAPRPSPPTPGAVLPPPMLDVLQYWKKSGGHRDRPARPGPSQD